MEEPVSTTRLHRSFSRILQGVREGRSYVVTSHGRAVARIVPIADDAAAALARAALFERLQRQPVLDAGRWSREELYEDDP